jgi:hypothetical protein
MGDPELRAKRSYTRKRNYIAKKMIETKTEKTHMSQKDIEKQRKWRLKNDPEGDYDALDEFLLRTK